MVRVEGGNRTGETMIRVVLADDHPFVRRGIRNILQKTSDIKVVGEAEDGRQALQMVDELKPDVLVLDIEMPGMKGYEVAQSITKEDSQLPILVLSAHDDKHYILSMLAEGVDGYLTKDEVPETVVKAVRGVALGERGWVSRRVAARIAVWLQSEKPDLLDLSDAELKYLRLLIAGKNNQQIGNSQGLTTEEVDRRLMALVTKVRNSLNHLGKG